MHEKFNPKPDDRSDNAEKLDEMIGDTVSNIEETKERMENAQSEEKKMLQSKNERRKAAIESFKNEIEDELKQ